MHGWCCSYLHSVIYAGSLFQARRRLNGIPGPVSESKEHNVHDDLAAVSESEVHEPSDSNPPSSIHTASHVSAADTIARLGRQMSTTSPRPADGHMAGATSDTVHGRTASHILDFPSAASQIRPNEDYCAGVSQQSASDANRQGSLLAEVLQPNMGVDTLQTLARMPTPDLSTVAAMDALSTNAIAQDAPRSVTKVEGVKHADTAVTETMPVMGLNTMSSLERMPTPDMSTAMLMEALNTQRMEDRFGPRAAEQASDQQDHAGDGAHRKEQQFRGQPADQGDLRAPAQTNSCVSHAPRLDTASRSGPHASSRAGGDATNCPGTDSQYVLEYRSFTGFALVT